MSKSEYQKLLANELFAVDEEIQKMKDKARELYPLYNKTSHEETDRREEILRELFGKTGANISVKPPFHCSHGLHIEVGEDFYCNTGGYFQDVHKIIIGDRVMIGPNVSILTAMHPLVASERATGLEYALPVTLEDDVWLGSDVTINPGVTIGKGAVIGSGSIVTKDIPANVVAFGNPCRVHREITAEDKMME
jgi:maltose O-acetyltransferase